MINEDDDIINKIKDAFGLQAGKPNKNFLIIRFQLLFNLFFVKLDEYLLGP